jgi:hypothetical protein
MARSYCHIDHTETPDKYLVRVTALVVASVTKDAKNRDVIHHANGDEVGRFEVTSQLRGRKLREFIEQEARRRGM